MRVAIVGAGPIGMEAALAAVELGHDVLVVESGTTVGGAILSNWHHVEMFTPWSMNVSTRGLDVLRREGHAFHDMDACPTGQQFVEDYLEPLAEYLDARIDLRLATDVVAIGRGSILKTERIGDARRGTPFRLLLDSEDGEVFEAADLVLDCSGVLDMPGFIGPGGLPALGEADVDAIIHRRVPDILGEDRDDFADRHTLVVGAGMSAALSLDLLLKLKVRSPKTTVSWATREGSAPYVRIDGDPLPSRDALAVLGNKLAAGDPRVTWHGGCSVRAIERTADGFEVTFERENGREVRGVFDEVIANVGYRPNTALFEELQVHQCYASQAPMKLAAALLAEQGAGGDCLTQTARGVEVLRSPEPDFFVLGAKSYGRQSHFLLRVGYEQVNEVFASIGKA